jgi:PLP dependent protein
MIANNWKEVQARIRAAASRVGRNSQDVACMAVSKTFPPERIREAYQAGLRLFGENRVQEFAEKWPALRDLPGAEWHMIGHLQSNKASKAAELFAAVDSLDSLRLAEKLNLSARLLGRKLPVLIEINMGEEAAKSGLAAESPSLEELLEKAGRLDHLEFRGLMAIPPFTEDPEQARFFFRQLRGLRDRIAARALPSVGMHVLSMGMSHDFEIAVEEGSTCVRVGTAIFGERTTTSI